MSKLNAAFKKVILLSTLTVLAGVGVVYVLGLKFGSSFSPSNTLITAEGVDEQVGLKLSMTLQKTEYSLDEPINITLTIINISNQTVNFFLAPSSWDFLVYNDTNTSVYEWLYSGRVFPMWVENVPLDPGMSLTNGFTWQQTFWNTTTASGGQVSPGTYYIVGQYGHSPQTTPIKITIG